MERLLTVSEVMERYHCCRQTAARIIRAVPHLTDPHLMTYESCLKSWEQRQMAPKVARLERRRA